MKNYLLLLFTVICLNSCGEQELILTENVENRAELLVSEKAMDEILSFADEVASFTKQGVFKSEVPIEGKARRKYIAGLGDCYNVSGNCLDDLIVTPSTNNISISEITNSERIIIWNESQIGELMNDRVKNKQLSVDYIENENGLFLQYSNVSNSDINMVIPLR